MIRSALLLSLCLFGWSAESTLAGLAEYRISQGQRGLASIRQDIFRADPAQSSAWEARLLDILRRPDLSVEARNETCRLLLPVASAACIPAMAPLLGDPATTVASRHVLLALEARLVVPVLRQAALTANGLVQAGLLGDLGQRHDVASIPAMASRRRAISAGLNRGYSASVMSFRRSGRLRGIDFSSTWVAHRSAAVGSR